MTRLGAAILAPTDDEAAAEAAEVSGEIQTAARKDLKAKADAMKAKRLAASEGKQLVETTGEVKND